MSDTTKRGINEDDGRLIPEREIDQEDNEFLKNKDNPDWPKAIVFKKPASKLNRDLLYSSKQIRGIRYGE